MKIEISEKQVVHLDAKNRAHIKYKLRFWDQSNNPIEDKALQVYEGNELLYDTDTNFEGVAEVELIMDVINETRKTLNFVIGNESRTKVFLLEVGDQKINSAIEKVGNPSPQDRANKAKRFFPEINVGIFEDKNGEVLIDSHGNIITSTSYDKIHDPDLYKNFIAEKNSKYYLLNHAGNTVGSDAFDEIVINTPIANYYRVTKNGKHGIMRNSGDYLISGLSRKAYLLKEPNHEFPFYQISDGNKYKLINDRKKEISGWYERIYCNEATGKTRDAMRYNSSNKYVGSIDGRPYKYLVLSLDDKIADLDTEGRRCMCSECKGRNTSYISGSRHAMCLKEDIQ
ncbi:MAG: hypothetical protein ACRCZE_02920 [Candidatus Altimarinota bacterium]